MKRPKMVIAINVLSFLILFKFFASALRVYMKSFDAGAPAPGWLLWGGMVGIVFTAWQTDGLARLRAVNRWIAVAVFSYTAASRLLLLSIRTQEPVPKPQALILIIALCLGAIWYLIRPTFRDFASKYSAERDQEDLRKRMQKLSLKKISKGLWS
jgi:hypothetical protein